MPAFQKHTKTIQRAPVPMADVCAELGISSSDPHELTRALLVRAFGFPPDTVVDLGTSEVVFTWEGAAEAAPAHAEKPSKKKKAEDPVVAPPPVEVNWTDALNAAQESK